MDKKDQTRQDTGNEKVETPEISREDEEINDSNIVSFKKVMRGYNPVEVNEYIEMLNASLAGAQQVLDEQSAELKDTLAFVSRERDQLKAEKADMAKKAAAYDEKASELKAAQEELENLKTQNTRLLEKEGIADPRYAETITEENEQLKSKIESYSSQLSSTEKQKNDYSEKTAELNTVNAKLTGELARLREANRNLESEIAAFNENNTELSGEFSTLKATIKRQENELAVLKTENKEQEVAFAEFRAAKAKQANELMAAKDLGARQTNEVTQLREANAKQAEDYKNQKKEIEEIYAKEQQRLNNEIRQFKLKITELEADLKATGQTNNKMAEEIASLREENTKQAYDFASQKKDMEMQNEIERLNRSETLQVHSYNILKSEELLNEITKQIMQAKASLDQLNSKK